MAQRHVEILIGRLLTDERFRAAFLANPENALRELCGRGLELSRTEIAALVATNRELWRQAAAQIDPRLQKASLEPSTHLEEEDNHV